MSAPTFLDHRMKLSIKALRCKCQSREEINKIILAIKPGIKVDALRKSRDKILKKLFYYELVKKENDKFYWYMYPNVFEKTSDRDTMVKHSNLLIPGLLKLIDIDYFKLFAGNQSGKYIDPSDLEILTKCVEDHLRYPEHEDIYRLLKNTRNVAEEELRLKKQLESSLLKELKNDFGEKIYYFKGKKPEIYVGSNISSLISNYLIFDSGDYSLELIIQGDEIKAHHGVITIAKGRALLMNLNNYIENQINNFNNINLAKRIKILSAKRYGLKKEIEKEARILILKIQSGEPLHGRCDACPEVIVATKITA